MNATKLTPPGTVRWKHAFALRISNVARGALATAIVFVEHAWTHGAHGVRILTSGFAARTVDELFVGSTLAFAALVLRNARAIAREHVTIDALTLCWLAFFRAHRTRIRACAVASGTRAKHLVFAAFCAAFVRGNVAFRSSFARRTRIHVDASAIRSQHVSLYTLTLCWLALIGAYRTWIGACVIARCACAPFFVRSTFWTTSGRDRIVDVRNSGSVLYLSRGIRESVGC